MKPKHLSPIRVGPFDYRIRAHKGLAELAASGVMSESLAEIAYDPAFNEQIQKDTILHEALHCIWKQTSLRVEYPDEGNDSPGERLIETLAPRILALLRDNPALAEWLISA